MRVGFWIIVGVVALGVVVTVVNLLTFDWDAYLARSVHSFVHNGQVLSVTPALAIGTWIFDVGSVLLLWAFLLLVGFLARNGRNWARIVLTISSGALILGLFAGHGVLASYVNAAASAALIVLLWLRESNTFFREVKADREIYRSLRPVRLV